MCLAHKSVQIPGGREMKTWRHFSGEGRDTQSEALAEHCCLSTACYHSGFRKKGSWTSENKHPALRRYLVCTASFSSTRKINSRRLQNLPVLGKEGLTAIYVLLWAAGAPCLFDALAAVAPCSAFSLQFVFMRELHDAALTIRASSSAETIRVKKEPSFITVTSLSPALFPCSDDSDEREVPSFS